MKKIAIAIIVCLAIFTGYKLWAQGGTAPIDIKAKDYSSETRHVITTTKKADVGKGVPTHSMMKWVDFRNYDKCNRRYYDYIAPGEDSACRDVFYTVRPTFEIDTAKSYVCRFKNNYPPGNPCPVGSIIQRVDFSSYYCKSHSDISSGSCYAGYNAPRVVSDPTGVYEHVYFCGMTTVPRLCFDDDVDAESLHGLDRCCIVYVE